MRYFYAMLATAFIVFIGVIVLISIVWFIPADRVAADSGPSHGSVRSTVAEPASPAEGPATPADAGPEAIAPPDERTAPATDATLTRAPALRTAPRRVATISSTDGDGRAGTHSAYPRPVLIPVAISSEQLPLHHTADRGTPVRATAASLPLRAFSEPVALAIPIVMESANGPAGAPSHGAAPGGIEGRRPAPARAPGFAEDSEPAPPVGAPETLRRAAAGPQAVNSSAQAALVTWSPYPSGSARLPTAWHSSTTLGAITRISARLPEDENLRRGLLAAGAGLVVVLAAAARY